MAQTVVIYHSGYGHTQRVAQFVAQGANAALIAIDAEGNISDADWAALDGADAIIFGSPTYMGMASWQFKKFADASSKRWFSGAWKDKVAGGFTNSLSFAGDKANSLSSILTLAMQQGMIWVGTGLAPGAHSNSDAAPDVVNRLGYYVGVATQSDNAAPDITPPPGDREFARLYGVRITEITTKMRG